MGSNRYTLEINKIQNTITGGVFCMYMLVPTEGIPFWGNYFQDLYRPSEYLNWKNDGGAFVGKNSIDSFSFGYDMNEVICSDEKKMIMNVDKKENLQKLDQIEALKDGWNGNKARAIDRRLISSARKVVTALNIQPELFPTACNSLQIEYEKENGEYLEIEMNLESEWHVFKIDGEGKESEYKIPADVGSINKVVDGFYE